MPMSSAQLSTHVISPTTVVTTPHLAIQPGSGQGLANSDQLVSNDPNGTLLTTHVVQVTTTMNPTYATATMSTAQVNVHPGHGQGNVPSSVNTQTTQQQAPPQVQVQQQVQTQI